MMRSFAGVWIALLLVSCGTGETILLGASGVTGGATMLVSGGGGQSGGGGTESGGMAAIPIVDGGPDADADAEPPDGGDRPYACSNAGRGPIGACSATRATNEVALRRLFAWPSEDSVPQLQLYGGTTPLVANFTDDNGDGRIDTCDVPDVLVTASEPDSSGYIYVIDGALGTQISRFPSESGGLNTPAIADLDRDGEVEVVAFSPEGRLLIFDHLGNVELIGTYATSWSGLSCTALAVADLDGDDEPEIIAGFDVFDRHGRVRFSYAGMDAPIIASDKCITPFAVNILPDDPLEIFFSPPVLQTSTGDVVDELATEGNALAVELNGNGLPELLVLEGMNLQILHEGAQGSSTIPLACIPTSIASVQADGDALLETAVATSCGLSLMRFRENGMQETVWNSDTGATDGAVTAFDLSGDGIDEVIHLTSIGMFVLDGATGTVLVNDSEVRVLSNFSAPIVVDVDNDGSADILAYAQTDAGSQLVAYGSSTTPFPATRRIYNQVANQVTHIDENGMTIARPAAFRASHQNARIEDGVVCVP